MLATSISAEVSLKFQVGLVYKGNEMQIPLCVSHPICTLFVDSLNNLSAYELYADLKSGGRPVSNVGSHDTVGQELPTMADRFKKAFSNKNVKVHFVGAWCVI